jgi:hypothetical protein
VNRGTAAAGWADSAAMATNPLRGLLRGAMAGAAGTVAMDLVWYARYRRGGGNDAFPAWARSSIQQRHDILKTVGDEIIARKEELGRLLSREEGSNCAVQHGDWRCRVAALLGRFLPKLRAAGNSGLFS